MATTYLTRVTFYCSRLIQLLEAQTLFMTSVWNEKELQEDICVFSKAGVRIAFALGNYAWMVIALRFAVKKKLAHIFIL